MSAWYDCHFGTHLTAGGFLCTTLLLSLAGLYPLLALYIARTPAFAGI